LIDDSFANKTKEDVSRCLNEVVGLSEEDAELATAQAQQHGVSLIEEFPLEYAEAYLEELTSRGIVCEMVPIEEYRVTASETSIGNDQNGLFNLNGMWELGLIDDSFANKTKEDVSRCLNEVVGLSEEDAELATAQAQQHGVSLIEEFPLEYAEAYLEELTSRGIVCEMVPIEE